MKPGDLVEHQEHGAGIVVRRLGEDGLFVVWATDLTLSEALWFLSLLPEDRRAVAEIWADKILGAQA